MDQEIYLMGDMRILFKETLYDKKIIVCNQFNEFYHEIREFLVFNFMFLGMFMSCEFNEWSDVPLCIGL